MRNCFNCKKVLSHRYQQKYCSNRCQVDYQYQQYIEDWKLGQRTGVRGLLAKNISQHIKRYLIKKNKEQCSVCFWNKRHTVTGHVPLEIDHIDGNSENNIESNLRLVCPNCHSLSTTFRNLNKGKGRKWRK